MQLLVWTGQDRFGHPFQVIAYAPTPEAARKEALARLPDRALAAEIALALLRDAPQAFAAPTALILADAPLLAAPDSAAPVRPCGSHPPPEEPPGTNEAPPLQLGLWEE
ncbi:MAG: hypothetical protein IT210_11915 [Armatimonadetes bacterium]|nr:hypothetical protein [Armatimonadota bacterium]